MLNDKSRELLLLELENKIGYKFVNKGLLNQALVHSSYSNENKDYKNKHNERLEFLGDAVLELVFSEFLFKDYRPQNEGFLTKFRSRLVCEKSFAKVADHFDLSDYLLLGKGEEITGGRSKDSIKADTFEALCGAMYLDGGFEVVKKFINPLLGYLINDLDDPKESFIDYKSILQEYFHKQKETEFKYILCKEEGLAHNKTFYMDVYLNSKSVGSGKGKNKKQAEQAAARDALLRYGVIDE